MSGTDDHSPDGYRDPRETQRLYKDTENHNSTRMSGNKGKSAVHQTTVFKFRDPRQARPRIYKAVEGLPWAITDLAKKMNTLIDAGEVEWQQLNPGDVVQVAVVSYFCDGKVMKPETTPDSPAYATLPYKIVIADAGYWTAEPALPKEALMHFKLPETVGDLIPHLTSEQQADAMVSLQLKEATHAGGDTEVTATETTGEFRVATLEECASTYETFQKASAASESAGGDDEWRDLTACLDDVARDEDASTRIKRKLSERLSVDKIDFGFSSK